MFKRSIRRLVLLASLLALGGGFWLLWPASPPAPAPEQRVRLDQLTASQQHWMTTGPRHYRLTIEHTLDGQPCHAVAEIRDTTIVAIEQTTCHTPPPTVADLFHLIERHTTAQVCGPNGCSCDGVLVADVTYDPTLGYPQHVSIQADPTQRTPWPLRDRLRSALHGGGWGALTGTGMACTLIGMIDPEVQVLELTPLP